MSKKICFSFGIVFTMGMSDVTEIYYNEFDIHQIISNKKDLQPMCVVGFVTCILTSIILISSYYKVYNYFHSQNSLVPHL